MRVKLLDFFVICPIIQIVIFRYVGYDLMTKEQSSQILKFLF